MSNMSNEEIKEYVIKTIRFGTKERIVSVLARYNTWLKENKNGPDKKTTEELAREVELI